MNIWRVLGLEPTRDLGAIRRAYARAARQYHPEEQPEEFQRVHDAYQQALRYARSAPRTGASRPYSPEQEKDKGYKGLGNKSVPKKSAGGAYSSGSTGGARPLPHLDTTGPRRPRAEARIVPLGGKPSAPEPAWLREETAEGQAELFRRAPAMGAFREVWQSEKKRSDKKAWREFFSSPAFLAVQREEGFAAALCDFVEQEVKNGRQLPQKFLLELAIAYGIRFRSGKEIYYLSFAAFPGIESIGDILRLGRPLDELSHEEDKIWAACWRDYFELLTIAKSGGFEDPDRSGRWKELFDRYRKEKITERPETTRRRESEVEARHPFGLRLLAFFLEKHPLPPEAAQYLYDSLKLEAVVTTSAKKHYKPLLDALRPVLPDQAAIKAEKEAMRLLYAAIADFMRLYDRQAYFTNVKLLPAYDQRPTQGELREARKILESPQFQQLYLTRKFQESSAAKRIMDSGTCLPALLAEEYQKHRGNPVADTMLEWCLSTVRLQEHDPEFFYDRPYVYPLASQDQISLENREFWYYYLSTAFPAALTTNREIPIAQIIWEHCHPSLGWRRVFTGFDENLQRIPEPKGIAFQVGEREVFLLFHFFYQQFVAEGKEVEELFPWEELQAIEDPKDFRFWLALPLAIAGDTPRAVLRRELYQRLAALPLDGCICSDLADCLVNHITTPKKPFTGLLRGKMEDGKALYGYEVRQNRTLEVFRLQGILRRDSMRWERPFPNERLAQEEAERYISGLLAPGMNLVNRVPVHGKSPREKASILVSCLGEGIYTQEDRQADEAVKLPATEDFLGYGVRNHGHFTSVIYQAYRKTPYRGAIRFGKQEEERFRLLLTLEIWPFGSPKAKEQNRLALLTRLGAVGTGCYVIGNIGLGKETYTLVSSSTQHKLYALREGSEKTFSGSDLAALIEVLLYPSEWNAVEFVESWQ